MTETEPRKVRGDNELGIQSQRFGMTDQSCCDNARVLVPGSTNSSGPLVGSQVEEVSAVTPWRRQCGCIRTSEKLKKILGTFPNPPPPTPSSAPTYPYHKLCGLCGYSTTDKPYAVQKYDSPKDEKGCCDQRYQSSGKSWKVVADLVQVVQLSVTATALALYYLIYCYMQLVYFTLRSALYFHNADGAMKITIGVVTVTSIIVGFNLMLRMERIIGVIY